jgi:3-dehydroquinate dehydratase/shikimate dehydrogenase
MSKLALCLTHKSIEKNLDELKKYSGTIDLAELRIDCLKYNGDSDSFVESVQLLVKKSPVPLILTIRRVVDGGFWKGSQKKRLKLLARFLELDFSYVDLEDDLLFGPESKQAEELEGLARNRKIRIIRSFHDFKGIPDNLIERLKKNSLTGDLPKAAVTLNHSRDIVTFMKAVNVLEGSEKILLAMGERGFFSRILTEKLGSYLTFTSPSGGMKAAPGQIDPYTLREQYRYGSHRKNDPLYGIIGNPVIQSRSPELHNGWLEKKGLPGVYVPFLLDDMKDFSRLDELFNFSGLSVTIPFKEKILPFLDVPSRAVTAIGACNTYYKKEGKVWGDNSDAPGFLYPLLDALSIGREREKPLKGYKCSLIGAGGASRGVLYALVNGGADVLILNRTLERAEKLAMEFGAKAAVLSAASLPLLEKYNKIIVQTTSLGMAPMEEKDPLFFYSFKGYEFVYDIIYKPAETVMMKRAKEAGCSILGGWKMLQEQGKVQFELFTGSKVPQN